MMLDAPLLPNGMIDFPLLFRDYPALESLWRLEALRVALVCEHKVHPTLESAWTAIAVMLPSGYWQVIASLGDLLPQQRHAVRMANPEVCNILSRQGWRRNDLSIGVILPHAVLVSGPP